MIKGWNEKTITRNCLSCNKKITFFKSRNRHFCSLKCFYKWREGSTTSGKGKPWTEARRKAQEFVKRTKKTVISGKEYAEDWHQIRKEIYERDNWTCQECNQKCKGIRSSDSKLLIQCHHINYDITDNESSNLITLCASCHMKTNFKRKDWIEYYRIKMENCLNK